MVMVVDGYTGVAHAQLDEPEEAPPGLMLFRYRWHHIPSGLEGDAFVVCRSVHEACALVGSWNCSREWHYFTPFLA